MTSGLTHKSPINALLGVPNFRHSVILARRLCDQPQKEEVESKKWDEAAIPDFRTERQVLALADIQRLPDRSSAEFTLAGRPN